MSCRGWACTTVGNEAHARAQRFRESVQQQMLAGVPPEQRARAEAALREQARQNAYRIAEALI